MFSRSAIRTARAAAPASRLVAASRIPAVRTYAAAAAPATENVRPPIAVFGLDGTYATALYTAAVKTSTLDPTAKALSTLEAIVAKDAKLATVLSAPTLSAADKDAIVAELTKQAGANSQDTVKNFLGALAENNRLGLLPGVLTKFGEIMSAARGEIELIVTSATQLDNKTLNRLESAITKSSYVGQGKKLKVTNQVRPPLSAELPSEDAPPDHDLPQLTRLPQVNPEIVGGLIVEIGDRTIDLSVSSKIAKLNKLLTDTL
ncbi:ATP synthase subunit 5 [Colletotrichum spinosum]|uniref:ATP synthase subunit 5, mitochondrial n=1 Tax=Colletotrichum spinosum TaxID=1347390 RepID=A0A4R8QKS4_9PEZI|nr:ATP synthase subunit 5 [Colletotrichum spinosum]